MSLCLKGSGVTISNNGKKVEFNGGTACRGRDAIERGMVVTWTVNVHANRGLFLGVVSSNCTNFETYAAKMLVDPWGIAYPADTIFQGNNGRNKYVEGLGKPQMGPNYWDSTRPIKVKLDYKTMSSAILTFDFEGKKVKLQLQELEEGDSWFMCVDCSYGRGWCKITDFSVE